MAAESQRSDDRSQARSEAAALLGVDIDHLSAADTLRVDMVSALRFRKPFAAKNKLGQADPTNRPCSPFFQPRFRLSGDPSRGPTTRVGTLAADDERTGL
jgi:hypothetical protein